MIESVSAVTLATHNMVRAVAFYRMLGFEIIHGGDDAAFTSFRAGTNNTRCVRRKVNSNFTAKADRWVEPTGLLNDPLGGRSPKQICRRKQFCPQTLFSDYQE